PLAMERSLLAPLPSANTLAAPLTNVTVPCEMVNELNPIFAAGIVENVNVPAVLNMISSPASGMVPPDQFAPLVQSKPTPAVAAQVLVAAKPVAVLNRQKLAINVVMTNVLE